MTTRAEQERYAECRSVRCKHLGYCAVHHGKHCQRFGGKKIPRFIPTRTNAEAKRLYAAYLSED